MSNALTTLVMRATIDGRTFAIKSTDGKVSYRDITGSKTGKFITEKQQKVLDALRAKIEALVAAVKLPAEKSPTIKTPAQPPKKLTPSKAKPQKVSPADRTRIARAAAKPKR